MLTQVQMRIPKLTLAQGQLRVQLPMTNGEITARGAQISLQTTVDEVHVFHCASHPFRPREVQAPIRAVDSEQVQVQVPIAAAQTLAEMSTLPVDAVAAGIAYRGGRGESSYLHEHNHNRILSAHSRYTRVLPVQLVAEAARSGPAHSHSYSHSHSHSHSHSCIHSPCHGKIDYMRPLLGSRK